MIYGKMNVANKFTKIISANETKFDAKCMMRFYVFLLENFGNIVMLHININCSKFPIYC